MKYLSIIRYILIALSAVSVLSYFVGAADVDLMLIWAYVLLGIAIVSVIVLPLFNVVQNPKGAVRSLVGLVIVLAVLGVAFALSSDVPVPNSGGGFFEDSLTLKLSDTGLFAAYAAMTATIAAVVISEIGNVFK